jgi:vesicle-fusing ATPase
MRQAINATLTDKSLEMIEQKRSEFLLRIGCRVHLLPSGAALPACLSEPAASFIYGKLLYGGATRYRLLASSNSRSPPRQAGVRTAVKPKATDNEPCWIMYGGASRMYESVDMGPAAILEVVLLQRGQALTTDIGNAMVVSGGWNPQNMFGFYEEALEGETSDNIDETIGYSPSSLSGKDRNNAFRSDFTSSVGGLQPQIDAIVRRVLDGRVIRPAEDGGPDSTGDETSQKLTVAALEAEELAILGLSPVRGLLLYGPPGCGKTALAREISRSLRARAPKIIAAPEILDRWVGGSEKALRALFADAEAELAICNGDATKSALHVIVIDEIDAVFRKRSSAEDSGEATRSSVVNQILAKLDGVNAIPNVLLIGMTNRRELLDDALLRPGRLEVQIEIPLPNKQGRREILQIHFDALRKRGRLSQPLCRAIDGVERQNGDASIDNVKNESLRKSIRRKLRQVVDVFPMRTSYDLAGDYSTGGYSGADIAGLVVSFAVVLSTPSVD